MPEWYLAIAVLAALSVAGAVWPPLLLCVPLLALAVLALLVDAGLGARRARFQGSPRGVELLRLRGLTAALYLLQPLARLEGRVAGDLTPWRRHSPAEGLAAPGPRAVELWSDQWHSPEDRVEALMGVLSANGSVAIAGGDWDRWDLQVRGGSLGGVRVRSATEEHGSGAQLVRIRWWPYVPRAAWIFVAVALALAAGAYAGDALGAAAVLTVIGVVAGVSAAYECATASAAVRRALLTSPDGPAALRSLRPLEPRDED
jgi:hypothetical protein